MKSGVSSRSACVDLYTVVWEEIRNTLRAQADVNPSRSLRLKGFMTLQELWTL